MRHFSPNHATDFFHERGILSRQAVAPAIALDARAEPSAGEGPQQFVRRQGIVEGLRRRGGGLALQRYAAEEGPVDKGDEVRPGGLVVASLHGCRQRGPAALQCNACIACIALQRCNGCNDDWASYRPDGPAWDRAVCWGLLSLPGTAPVFRRGPPRRPDPSLRA